MRKKTLKIFVNSFVVSLFTIWAVNGLFAVPEKRRNAEISIPDKNIALFFQHEAPTVNYSASTPVRAFSLAALAPKPAEREIFIDKNLFVFDDEEEGIRINSVEDAADIPLEYSAAASVFNPAKSMTASNDSQPVAEPPQRRNRRRSPTTFLRKKPERTERNRPRSGRMPKSPRKRPKRSCLPQRFRSRPTARRSRLNSATAPPKRWKLQAKRPTIRSPWPTAAN